MSPLDKELLNRKVKLIEEDLAKLAEFEKITLDEYIQSLEIKLQVERLLERIVGRVIDINYHILKEEFNTIYLIISLFRRLSFRILRGPKFLF